jgi:hypothetical protein
MVRTVSYCRGCDGHRPIQIWEFHAVMPARPVLHLNMVFAVVRVSDTTSGPDSAVRWSKLMMERAW